MRCHRAVAMALGLLGLGWGAGEAAAGTLFLSDFSSDSTPASVIGARFDFEITGPAELTFTITNDTIAPDEYFINFAAFNATDNVAGLTLESVGGVDCVLPDASDCGWTLDVDDSAAGFGTYDFSVQDPGRATNQVAPNQSLDFVFTITGSNPFDPTYFTTEFSTIPPGSTPGLAAAKFVRGPGDDSAFGVVVPEPATVGLVGLGLLGLAASSRRR